jgi:hypothetical protein
MQAQKVSLDENGAIWLVLWVVGILQFGLSFWTDLSKQIPAIIIVDRVILALYISAFLFFRLNINVPLGLILIWQVPYVTRDKIK